MRIICQQLHTITGTHKCIEKVVKTKEFFCFVKMSAYKLFNIMFVLAIFGQFTSSQSQIVASGICPCDVEVLADFSVSTYMGTWYEYAKYPVYFEADGVCIQADYTLQANGNVAVKNSQINGT